MRTNLWLAGGATVLLGFNVGVAGDWPQFRGPDGAGLAGGDKLPIEWAADKNIAWKTKLPGYGWSSPIVIGDKVIVTTAVTDNQQKPGGGMGGRGGGGRPGGGQLPGGDRPGGGRPGGGGYGGQRAPDKVFRWEIYCLDRNTGKEIWKQLALEAKPRIPTQPSNTYASETPVTDGERIYLLIGMMGLYSFDLNGKQLWHQDLPAYPMQMGWGTGSSPVVADGRVFVQCDNEEKSYLAAFDAATGKELWREPRDERTTWATPYVWKNKQRTELVTSGVKKVRSYDPATGKLHWELGSPGGQCNATPVGDADLLFVGNGGRGGGMGGPGGPGGGGRNPPGGDPPGGQRPGGGRGGMGGGAAGTLFAIKAGASGNISLKEGEKSNAGVAWTAARAAPSMASALLYQGNLYTLEQRGGQITCVDARTGETKYARERINGARGFTSSPWAADGKIYCLDDSGQTFVIQAGTEFKLLGQNPLNEMCWSSPAAANGALYVRTVDHLYCIK